MMNPQGFPTLLLDSSVLAKWYHSEENTDTALILRSGYLDGKWELRLADLSFYELANSLHYARYSSDEIAERVQSLFAMQLHTYAFDLAVLRTAMDYCSEKKIPIYDAYLVALATHERLTFVTADEKLRQKFPSDPIVVSLAQFSRRIQDKEE